MKQTFLCPECGSENPLGYRFCGTCGARLAARVQPSTITCSKCSLENPSGYNFCGRCGAKLDTVCPNCGATVPTDSRYCPNCAYLCGEGRYGEA